MNWQQFISNPKQLFLLDSLGAVLSAFLLGVVLVKLDYLIGMPRSVLYFLAILPCFFAVYSFLCYFYFPKSWRLLLNIIATANLFYCCTTIGLMIYFFQTLTIFDFIYFILELIIVLTIVYFEYKGASGKLIIEP